MWELQWVRWINPQMKESWIGRFVLFKSRYTYILDISCSCWQSGRKKDDKQFGNKNKQEETNSVFTNFLWYRGISNEATYFGRLNYPRSVRLRRPRTPKWSLGANYPFALGATQRSNVFLSRIDILEILFWLKFAWSPFQIASTAACCLCEVSPTSVWSCHAKYKSVFSYF
jgi:hypothetical protein